MRIITFLFVAIVTPLIGQAQKVLHHKLSSCDHNSYPEFMKERIVSKTVIKDTLSLTIGFSANCCISFRPTVSYKDDTLIFNNRPNEPDSLGFLEEVICMCDCCFELNLLIYPIRDTNFVFFYGNHQLYTSSEKYRTITPRYNIYEGDTINRIDKYGHRQGLWRIYNQGTNTLMKEIYFIEDFYESGRYKWMKTYKPSGTLEKYEEIDPITRHRQYYKPKEYKALIKSRSKQLPTTAK